MTEYKPLLNEFCELVRPPDVVLPLLQLKINGEGIPGVGVTATVVIPAVFPKQLFGTIVLMIIKIQ